MRRTRTAPLRQEMIHVLLSEAERATLRDLAARQRRTQSDVVREALDRYRREQESPPR